MTNPRHLWAGDWREESARARQAAAEAEALKRASVANATAQQQEAGYDVSDEEAPAPGGGVRRRRGVPALAVVAIVAILAGGAFAIGSLTSGGNDAAAPLPAVSNTPIKPKKGQ